MIVGGYGQFTKGLASNPTMLDIRYNQCVDKISYSQIQNRRTPELDEPPVTITCSNAQTIQADAVVVTASLGVLKSGNITFEPELPEQKRGAISRLGFGLLNKVYRCLLLIDIRLFWYMIIHSGTQRQTLWAAYGLLRREMPELKIHMKSDGEDSILSGTALLRAVVLRLVPSRFALSNCSGIGGWRSSISSRGGIGRKSC